MNQPRARRPRRVIAPPTNLEADQSDDLVDQRGSDRSDPQRPARGTYAGSGTGPPRPGAGAAGSGPEPVDPHEEWILAQRPPHWGRD